MSSRIDRNSVIAAISMVVSPGCASLARCRSSAGSVAAVRHSDYIAMKSRATPRPHDTSSPARVACTAQRRNHVDRTRQDGRVEWRVPDDLPICLHRHGGR